MPYDAGAASAYVTALCRELQIKSSTAGYAESLYIGGGTPALLEAGELDKILSTILRHYRLSPDAEITAEANPGTVDLKKLRELRALGINRLSIGIQSLSDSELRTLGRIHTASEAALAASEARAAGFKNLSLDLIYGIPSQTMQSWQTSLEHLLSLEPSHVSAYELTVEKNTPLALSVAKGTLAMPDEELVLQMQGYAVDRLSSCGYAQYEISNFAKKGCESRHNLNYWNRGEYLGFGAGAHSFADNTRSHNTREIGAYIAALSAGSLPQEGLHAVSEEEALREFIFLGLRKTEGIATLNSYIDGRRLLAAAADLREEGFLEVLQDRLLMTRKGLLLSNTVVVKLLEALGL